MSNGLVAAKGYEKNYLDIVSQKSEFMLTPAENLVRIIKQDHLEAQATGQIALDFGSGDGRHTEYLCKLGYKVLATDVTQGALDATKLRMKSTPIDTALLNMAGDRIPLNDRSASLIIGWEVLHWLGSKELFTHYLKEFHRVLKSGGHFVLTMPKEDHYLKIEGFEVGLSQYKCTAHDRSDFIMYAPNLVTLKAMLADFGFSIERTKCFSHSDAQLEGRSLDLPFSMYALNCVAR